MPKRLTTEKFIEKSKAVHGDKYDYSKVEYVNYDTKICIICKEHGEFWQTPNNHLGGHGCPICNLARKDSKEVFIEKSKAVHSDKYDYSRVNYTNSRTKVCIICPEHGEFWQTPHTHLRCKGCPKCNKHFMDKNYFIERAKTIHGDKYDYSKVEYVNSITNVCIFCPEHGEFWQTPHNHLNGKGCQICNNSKLEEEIKVLLDTNNIKYVLRERKLPWLERLELDFYLPEHNVAIECQGLQHFEPVEIFGGEKSFLCRLENDKKKKRLCDENGVKLLYYSNLKIEYPYPVFEDKEKIIEEIFG